MDGSKSIPTANKGIHLSLKTLKKLTTDVERAASNHLTSYSNIPHKRKIVQEEYELYLKNNQYKNSTLKKPRFNCMGFLESEDSKNRKITSNNNRKICTEMPHP